MTYGGLRIDDQDTAVLVNALVDETMGTQAPFQVGETAKLPPCLDTAHLELWKTNHQQPCPRPAREPDPEVVKAWILVSASMTEHTRHLVLPMLLSKFPREQHETVLGWVHECLMSESVVKTMYPPREQQPE